MKISITWLSNLVKMNITDSISTSKGTFLWDKDCQSTKQRELCYKNYNQNMTLSEWDIEQERYWQVTTVNSILEYIVYSCALVEEKFQDIPFWKSLSVFICEKSMIWCALQLKKYFKICPFGKFCPVWNKLSYPTYVGIQYWQKIVLITNQYIVDTYIRTWYKSRILHT